ncbi:MAG: glycogen debranching protein GlgX [Candidatus Obscuribacterales bacterium]|nr:glycogen debranching protein GlgX [Candidatus Obscuribacterales bacterium]
MTSRRARQNQPTCCHEEDSSCPIHRGSAWHPGQENLGIGRAFPLGSSVTSGGVNFSVYSTCDDLELLLFDAPESPQPAKVIRLDSTRHKTFHYWHILVPDLLPGQIYAYRAHGPYQPDQGLRFDAGKVLLDPYTRAVANTKNYSRLAASQPGDNCATALRSVVVDTSQYDWEDDTPLRTPYSRSVIYELHVAGFTKSPTSGIPADKRGTLAGLHAKIPYLKSLGITAVELLPINQFDDQDAPPDRRNYWGYSPIAFFAPHVEYSSSKSPLGPLDEFRDMVKALHRAGIEVILDVVFNHTAEGDEHGPTLSFRGLDNAAYYLLDADDLAHYPNFSGCGNTFRGSYSVPLRLILDCLRYWVSEMHVDGFRFDLASTLSRDIFGKPQPVQLSSILSAIESDPILAGTKLIAEAWDAAGLYQIGSFVNKCDWFAEWNGPFRDDIRRFVKGEEFSAKRAALRIAASSDIYSRPEREPNRSIHFVTCHDGFTLNDLVSYNTKHNESNGENGRDGASCNHSWNCGSEGTTADLAVQKLRTRQIKNFLTILFIAQGTPMLLMGDEIRRTQHGNNNAYCQDNNSSWFDWGSIDENKEILDFTRNLIAFTQSLNIFQQDHLLCTMRRDCGCPRIVWHGVQLNCPDWSNTSHSLAFSLLNPSSDERLHVILNAFWKPLIFELPPLPPEKHWHRIIDTALKNTELQAVTEHVLPNYQVLDRSCVVLIA